MRVFLSYSASDRPFVDQLRQSMEALGVTMEDPGTMPAGDEWARRVRQDLERSDAVLLVLPRPGAPGANNAFFEVGAAEALGKPVVAVVPKREVGDAREMPERLPGLHVLKAGRTPIASLAKSLVTKLKAA